MALNSDADEHKYPKAYLESELYKSNQVAVTQACTAVAGSQPLRFDNVFARGFGTQMRVVIRRAFRHAWRNVPLNCESVCGCVFGQWYDVLDL